MSVLVDLPARSRASSAPMNLCWAFDLAGISYSCAHSTVSTTSRVLLSENRWMTVECICHPVASIGPESNMCTFATSAGSVIVFVTPPDITIWPGSQLSDRLIIVPAGGRGIRPVVMVLLIDPPSEPGGPVGPIGPVSPVGPVVPGGPGTPGTP